MSSVFWNNNFTGKNLLKQAKCFTSQTPWNINNAKFINIAFVILKIFKMVTTTTFPGNLTQSKPDINEVKGKNGRVHPINFYGWPSKIYYDFLNFPGNPFLHLPGNYYSIESLYHVFLKILLVYAYYWRTDKVINEHFIWWN